MSSVFSYFVLLVAFQMISETFSTQLLLNGDVTVIPCNAVTGDQGKYQLKGHSSHMGTHTLVTSLSTVTTLCYLMVLDVVAGGHG